MPETSFRQISRWGARIELSLHGIQTFQSLHHPVHETHGRVHPDGHPCAEDYGAGGKRASGTKTVTYYSTGNRGPDFPLNAAKITTSLAEAGAVFYSGGHS